MKIDGKELIEGSLIIFPLEGYFDENQVNAIYEVTVQEQKKTVKKKVTYPLWGRERENDRRDD